MLDALQLFDDKAVKTMALRLFSRNKDKTQLVVAEGESSHRLVPKLLRTPAQRDKFAQEICQQIDSSDDQYRGLGERVERNEQLYRNQSGISSLDFGEEFDSITYPVVQPKIDGTVGDIFLAITGLTPYVQAIPLGQTQEAGDRVQSDLQLLADKGKFDMALWGWLQNALIGGVGILRVRFAEIDTNFLPSLTGMATGLRKGRRYGCFEFDIVHMSDFVAYPPSLGRIARLVTSGHRMPELRVQEIKELQDEDIYFSDVEVFGQDGLSDQFPHGRDRNFDLTSGFYADQPKDKSCSLREVITKADLDDGGREKYWLAVVDTTSTKLLNVAEYIYSVPHYVDLRFTIEQGSFWPSRSMAQDLQGIQIAINNMMNTLAYGNLMRAFGVLVVEGGTFTGKSTQIKPGNIMEVNGDPKNVNHLHNSFNAGEMQWIVNVLQDWADAISRKSQLATGQQLKSGATATEANALVAGDVASQSQFIRFASEAIEHLWSFMFEIYSVHYAQLKRTYGESLQATPEDMKGLYRFEVNGKTQGNTQQALMNKLQAIFAMSQQPTSQFDPMKTELAVAQALHLPFNVQSLVKDPAGLINAILSNPENVQAVLQNPQVQEIIMGLAQHGASQMAPAIALDSIHQEIGNAANDVAGMGEIPGIAGMGGGAPAFFGAPSGGPPPIDPMSA